MHMQQAFTTPFGRRAISHAMLAGQALAGTIKPGAEADKWRIFRALSEARARLGVSDRSLIVLNALISFHPGTQLQETGDLIVFPSNRNLSLRAHGMAAATLRRHLAALVEAGLISRKDSSNGKRYRRKADGDGEEGEGQGEAFGFSLAPLLARADEFEALAASVRAERQKAAILRQKLTCLRRDAVKLMAYAHEHGSSAALSALEKRLETMRKVCGKSANIEDLGQACQLFEALCIDLSKLAQALQISRNMSASESQNGRHIQNSNTDPHTELEPGKEEARAQTVADNPVATVAGGQGMNAADEERNLDGEEERAVPFALVLKACPEIAAYCRHGLTSWRDLMGAADLVRSMLGVSPSAYEEARDALGAVRTAVVVALILEKADGIRSAGGYLRSLVRKAEKGEFSVWPMLMAQLRATGAHLSLAGGAAEGA
jgi:replication initiation protein RepC